MISTFQNIPICNNVLFSLLFDSFESVLFFNHHQLQHWKNIVISLDFSFEEKNEISQNVYGLVSSQSQSIVYNLCDIFLIVFINQEILLSYF